MMKKLVLSLFLYIIMGSLIAGSVTAKPGCQFLVYLRDGKKISESDPVEIAIDKDDYFSEYAIKKHGFNSRWGKDLRVLWKGFILIPQDGMYCFSGKFVIKNSKNGHYASVKIGEDELFYVCINPDDTIKKKWGTDADSKEIELKKGAYSFEVFMNINGPAFGVGNSFVLKYWDVKRPLVQQKIYPGMLYHKVEADE
ncbi:MAG: hypothetical protein J6X55_13395 [Victivallales bacterium]|nr:hypothetical protein [Victivallales bacterium]